MTAIVFAPLFLSCTLTHRCKLGDGQDPLQTFGLPFEQVRIPTADGLTLDGWFVPQRGSDRTIIVCHGAGANKGNFIGFLPALVYEGYNVVFFDFRAHGASDGRTSTYGLLEQRDVGAVVDWLKRQRPEQARVIVGLGSSQGAMALALAAADARINAVVLDSPYVSPRAFASYHLRHAGVLGECFSALMLAEMSLQTGADFLHASAGRAVADMGDKPLLVIHGDDDVLMPAEFAQRLYDAATGPRAIWFGPGPHSNIVTTDPEAYARHLFDFLNEQLGMPGGRRRGRGGGRVRGAAAGAGRSG